MEKTGRKRKNFFIGVVIVVAVIIGMFFFRSATEDGIRNRVYTELSRSELIRSISVSGSVKSMESRNVYSTLSYPVQEIFVTVGDTVENGDRLAVLDTADLELEISRQRSSIVHAKKISELDLETKKEIYEDNIVLAEAGAVSVQALDMSRRNYELALAAYNDDSQEKALAILEKNLADSLVEAPVAGTVTEVFAEIGYPGSGLLFVIEDTENLMITTYLKEYDAGSVQPGQQVAVKSDATGDEVLMGRVLKIWPASEKYPSGETIEASTVEFETEIGLSDRNQALKIGMNVRLSIIVEKKDDVYSVPYNALTVNEAGEDIIYVIGGEGDMRTVEELAVQTGLESDFRTEISGEGIKDGVLVFIDATGLKDGEAVDMGTVRKQEQNNG